MKYLERNYRCYVTAANVDVTSHGTLPLLTPLKPRHGNTSPNSYQPLGILADMKKRTRVEEGNDPIWNEVDTPWHFWKRTEQLQEQGAGLGTKQVPEVQGAARESHPGF